MKVCMTFLSVLMPFASATDPFPTSTGDGNWQWVPVEGTKCMSNEDTGAYIRYSTNGNTNLGVYLFPGGACFNSLTCDFGVATDPHPAMSNGGNEGIFASRADNPLDDFNWVAIPYCSGDVFTGTNTKTGKRTFQGLTNIGLVLAKAQMSFTGVETLFVTGESAGGFGSVISYHAIRGYFPGSRGVLMDDSGPIIRDDYLAPCLQEKMRSAWNVNDGLPTDCPCNNDAGNLAAVWEYNRDKHPNDSFGLVSSVNDKVISGFFGFGVANCQSFLPLPLPLPFTVMNEGLEDLASTGVHVYMIPGNVHMHTSSDEFYTRTVQEVPMYEWVAQLLDPNRSDPETVRPSAEDHMQEAMSRDRAWLATAKHTTDVIV